MLINSKDIQIFNATLIKAITNSTETEIEAHWTGLSPLIVLDNPKFKTLELELLIECTTAQELEITKSNLCAELKQCKLEIKDYIYEGIAEGIEFNKLTTKDMLINATIKCTQEGKEEVITLTKPTQLVRIKGNCDIECVYVVTVPTSTNRVTINDVVFNKLEVGETLIIDGINKKVTVNNLNRINDVELIAFPTLKSGDNTITISPLTTHVTLKYSPKWQ